MLTTKRKQFLGAKFAGTVDELQNKRARVAAVVTKLKSILIDQHKEVEKLDKKEQQFVQGAVKAEELGSSCAQLEQERITLAKERDRLQEESATLEQRVKTEHSTLQEQQKISIEQDGDLQLLKEQLDLAIKEQDAVVYDKQKHQEVVKLLEDYEKKLGKFENLQQDLASQYERRILVSQLITELKKMKQQQKELNESLKNYETFTDDEKKAQEAFSIIDREHATLQQRKETLLQEIAKSEHERERLKKLKQNIAKQQKEIERFSVEYEQYHYLAQAFSKNGIQALLIEEAIPEIENEANALLAKLTDNQAQIFIESLRDLKKGGARETLDIRISDTHGVRPYELYSGGEAFRIDFALRIAISKLLARRAGTSLQTLIIDEGFGSQDEEGLQRLMDVLYAIQHDFSKVIVVSHLPVFKENFPVHFIVEKGVTGSVDRVEERV